MLAQQMNKYTNIKQALLSISTYADTVRTLDTINKYMITDSKNPELRSMRQKVYDIRRRLKLVPDDLSETAQTDNDRIHLPLIRTQQSVQTPTYTISYANISQMAVFGVFAIASGAMIFVQSLEVYARAAFDYPILATSGALLLIAASSVIRALKPTKLSLILVTYILSYESYLMIAGTLSAENHIRTEQSSTDPQIQMLQMQADDARQALDKVQARYAENGNGWYKAKYVQPAKSAYVTATQKLTQANSSFAGSDFSLLKILYRIGLIGLFALSVNYLSQKLKNVFA